MFICNSQYLKVELVVSSASLNFILKNINKKVLFNFFKVCIYVINILTKFITKKSVEKEHYYETIDNIIPNLKYHNT